MSFSLKRNLGLLWGLNLLAFLTSFGTLFLVYQASVNERIDTQKERLNRSCKDIWTKADSYLTIKKQSWNSLNTDDRYIILKFSLENMDGIEGGFWNLKTGFDSYAFPTYSDSSEKKDLPNAEIPGIQEINQLSLQSGKTEFKIRNRNQKALLLLSCPSEKNLGWQAWTMTWAYLPYEVQYKKYLWLLTSALAIGLLSGVWLFYVQRKYSRRIQHLVNELESIPSQELTEISSATEIDLDKIVKSVNLLLKRMNEYKISTLSLAEKLRKSDRMNTIAKISAGVAHELRNPLATIKLKAENSQGKSEERKENALSSILEQVDRIDLLIQKLLFIGEPISSRKETINIKETIKSIIQKLRPLIDHKSLTISFQCEDEKHIGNENSLEKILENLLTNAIQHSEINGRMIVTVTSLTDRIEMEIFNSDSKIAEEDIKEIFEPFFTKQSSGSGLGLTIVKEIVEMENGSYAVKNLSDGVEFRITLPWKKFT